MTKSVIFGFAGTSLTDEEKRFFAEHEPFGFILFARNLRDEKQIKELNKSLWEIAGRDDVPILIDQEGGRVVRLKPPVWRRALPAGVYAELAEDNLEQARQAVHLNSRLMAAELKSLGINVDCAPVADLLIPGCHDIVGDRAYGSDPEIVTVLAGAVAEGFTESGIMPVIKHIPGHGRAHCDSHEALPTVKTSLAELEKTDFIPFKDLHHVPWAMTAHIIYSAIDAELPATLSPKVVEVIRNNIGFSGLLLTDDLSMKALSGSFQERTEQSLKAGCDIILHCNGEMAEMQAVAEACPALGEESLQRIERGKLAISKAKPLADEENEEKLESLLKAA